MECRCGECGQVIPWRGLLAFDEDTGTVFRDGKEAKLTIYEGRVFDRLNRAKGQVVRHSALMDELYWNDPNGGAQENIVSVYVSRVRPKLAPLGIAIRNQFGIGYRLEVQ